MRFLKMLFSFCLLLTFACACKTPANTAEPTIMGQIEKFDFDINALDKDGLIGPASGKVSVDYKFCIPKGEQYTKTVQNIDPDIKIHPSSFGRNKCTDTQVTAVGSTHKPGHRKILLRLSELEFVKRFNRVWYE